MWFFITMAAVIWLSPKGVGTWLAEAELGYLEKKKSIEHADGVKTAFDKAIAAEEG